jgi:hypothetical protein
MGRKTLLPPLGLLTVAALLPQEWEFRLADLNLGPLTPASWQWADLVMITGMIIQREGIIRLVREAKEQGKTIIGLCTSLTYLLYIVSSLLAFWGIKKRP